MQSNSLPFEFAEITEDVYAWYNSTENPKVQYGIGKAGGKLLMDGEFSHLWRLTSGCQ